MQGNRAEPSSIRKDEESVLIYGMREVNWERYSKRECYFAEGHALVVSFLTNKSCTPLNVKKPED